MKFSPPQSRTKTDKSKKFIRQKYIHNIQIKTFYCHSTTNRQTRLETGFEYTYPTRPKLQKLLLQTGLLRLLSKIA